MSKYGLSEEFSRKLGATQEDIDRWVIQDKGLLCVKYINIVWNKEENKPEKLYKWRIYMKNEEVGNVKN